MSLKKRVYSILIVSASKTFTASLTSLLPESLYDTISVASGINCAKRSLAERSYDFIIINSPLPDDQGIRFAVDTCSRNNAVVLLLIKSDIHDEIYSKVSPHGVFTLPKPTSRTIMERALSWMISSRERLRRYENKTTSIEQKMEEIRLVNRAKWMLISHENMSEPDAHRYIEKSAMDRCISRKEIANEIICSYGK